MMDRLFAKIGLLFILFLPQLGSALELGVRPRFNTGFQFYEYNQDAFSFQSPDNQFTSESSEVKFKDFVPFVSGGLTFFIDRFFVDGFVQYSFKGNDTGSFTNKTSIPAVNPIPSDSVATTENQFGVNFDRLEFSFSVGYAITDNFVAYAGYKKANTHFSASLNTKINANFSNNGPVNPFLTGTVSGQFNLEYEYDGAFIGSTYSHNIDLGFLKGALSANVAIAFMQGDVDVDYRDIIIHNQLGMTQSLDRNTLNSIIGPQNLKGDTVGVSAGLSWHGLTPISGLSYLIGLNGYTYEFNGEENSPDFSETVVRMDFGVSYTF